MVMLKDNYLNPLSLYLEVINYNIRTLNRMMKFNNLFYDLLNVKVTAWMNKYTPEDDVNILEDKKITNDFNLDSIDTKFDDETFLTNSPTMPLITDNLAELEDMNIALMSDRPITMLKNLSLENIEKLNLFGIHTMKELEQCKVSKVSQNTGISRNQLSALKHQIQHNTP